MHIQPQVGIPFKSALSASLTTTSLAQVSTTSFVVAFWPMVISIVPEAALQPHQCEETFTLCHTLFKRLAETSLEFLNLEDLVKQWGSLLLLHSCREVG